MTHPLDEAITRLRAAVLRAEEALARRDADEATPSPDAGPRSS